MSGFEEEWARCAPWISAALAHAWETSSVDDVRRRVDEGKAQFWPFEGCAIITEIIQYGRIKAIRVWLAGGSLQAIGDASILLEEWALNQGCECVEIVGRVGWEKALPDYKKKAVVLVKEIGR
jgi:hypothetical protein